MLIWMILCGVLAISNAVFFWLWLTKEKPKGRKDLQVILQALKDLEERNGTLVEIRRVDPDSIFIWGAGGR